MLKFLLLAFCLSNVVYAQPIHPHPYPSHPIAKINIYRESSLWGMAMSAPIYVNHHYVGDLNNGGRFVKFVKPGRVYVASSPGKGAYKFADSGANSLSFLAKNGRTYYVKVSTPWQVNLAKPAFDLQLMN